MTPQEVRKMQDEEIGIELKNLRDRLYRLRVQAVTEKIEDNSQFRKIRKDIARLLTERRRREQARA